jgi:site-specific DNA recombinase
MTLQLLGSIAEFERNTIIENVRLGLTEFARKGGKATIVLGYDNIDKKLVINKSEANIVKLIFSLRAESGLGFSDIARYLNKMGYRTKRGNKYRSSSVSYIIRNPVYIGINRHKIKTDNEYSIKSMHPVIIDADLWNKAQYISKKPAEKIKRAASDSMPFKVYCMKCDALMKIFYTSSKGKSYRYLRCCNCSNYVNVEKLLKAVTERILAILDDKGIMEAAYNLINNNPSVSELQNKELTLIDSEICRFQKLKAHYLKLFESYKITEVKSFIDRVKEIEQQLSVLEKEKLEKSKFKLAAEKEIDYERYFAELKIRIAASEPAILKEICTCLVKSIKAYKNEVNIVLYL